MTILKPLDNGLHREAELQGSFPKQGNGVFIALFSRCMASSARRASSSRLLHDPAWPVDPGLARGQAFPSRCHTGGFWQASIRFLGKQAQEVPSQPIGRAFITEEESQPLPERCFPGVHPETDGACSRHQVDSGWQARDPAHPASTSLPQRWGVWQELACHRLELGSVSRFSPKPAKPKKANLTSCGSMPACWQTAATPSLSVSSLLHPYLVWVSGPSTAEPKRLPDGEIRAKAVLVPSHLRQETAFTSSFPCLSSLARSNQNGEVIR